MRLCAYCEAKEDRCTVQEFSVMIACNHFYRLEKPGAFRVKREKGSAFALQEYFSMIALESLYIKKSRIPSILKKTPAVFSKLDFSGEILYDSYRKNEHFTLIFR